MFLSKQVCLLTLLSIFFLSATAQHFTINAHFTGFPDGTKFYLVDPDLNSNVDSAILRKEKLHFKGQQSQPPMVYWLTATVEKDFFYTVLMFGNENLQIKGDKKQFPFHLSITGSKAQEGFNRIVAVSLDYRKFRDSAMRQMMAFTGPDAERKQDSMWAIVRVQDSIDGERTKRFMNENIDTYASVNTLFYFREDYTADSLRRLLARLSPEVRNSTFAKRIDNYLKVGAPLKNGDAMYDFTALDTAGKAHRLSDIKGKYVLIDFSTTYCGPCIQSIPELKAQKEKYGDSLEIVTMSCDMSREIWMKGLLRDNPQWLSLWDGKGTYGETTMKYGVQGFPTFCLIDPQGKVANISVGYGKDDNGKGSIEKMLEKYVKGN